MTSLWKAVEKLDLTWPRLGSEESGAGSLAVIGRAAAVADVFGVHLSGLAAWLVWVFIHLMYIVEFQNRLIVFIKWAIQDVTFSRGARLITGSASSDFNFDQEIAAQTAIPKAKTG